MKEQYGNMNLTLTDIQRVKYLWCVSGDLKVTALRLGLQLCYMEVCFVFCKWDSRERENGRNNILDNH
jgi:hypothetical protein